MAKYVTPEEQRPTARRNEQTEITTVKKGKTYTEKEVLELLGKAKEIENGRG